MTVQEIIGQASRLLSGRIGEAELYAWFNEVELLIQTQLFGAARADAVQYSAQEGEARPIAEGQYERIYSYWLLAKGHFKLQNQSSYTRYRKLYLAEYAAFRKWLIRTHGTADMGQGGRDVYLSAYGIAQKHGFEGSEQEWLASLRGRDGADGQNGRDGRDSADYDLQYDAGTRTLRMTRDGSLVRSFDLTQQASQLQIGSEQLTHVVTAGESCLLQYTWSSTAGGMGSAVYSVNGRQVAAQAVHAGRVQFEAGAYLQEGENAVTVRVRDGLGAMGTLEFSVTLLSLCVRSAFDATKPFSGEIPYRYTLVGAGEKSVHFVLDGSEVAVQRSVPAGRMQTCMLPAQAHGHHELHVYATTYYGGREVRSRDMLYDLICVVQGNVTPVIASDFCETEVMQHTRLRIPFVLHVPGAAEGILRVYEDNVLCATLTVPPVRQTYEYVCAATGKHSVTLACGEVLRTLSFTVTDAQVDACVATDSLVLSLEAAGRSNAEQSPATWTYTDAAGKEICAEFSGFDWRHDGWLQDAGGAGLLHIPAGGRVRIPVQPFAADPCMQGLSVEVLLALREVDDPDAVALECYTNRGLRLSARQISLEGEISRVALGFASERAVQVCAVIEPEAQDRLMHLYLDGVDSAVAQYREQESLVQAQPADLVLGSDGCTVEVYAVRVYASALSARAVQENFVACCTDAGEMVARQARGDIYDASGAITPASLPSSLPYVILRAKSLPQQAGEEYACGGTYMGAERADSFTFEGARISLAGKELQYGEICDFRIVFDGGFCGSDGSHAPTRALKPGQRETDTFCLVADAKDSGGVTNLGLIDLYCRHVALQTAAQQKHTGVRQGIDGLPVLVFFEREGSEELVLLGKYNLTHDASTPEIFGYDLAGAVHRQAWAAKNGSSDRVLFRSADFSGTGWCEDFAARFPQGLDDSSDLARLVGWVASCDPEAATGESLDKTVLLEGVLYGTDTAAYRRARFRAEVSDYFDRDNLIWYYLYTELFLAADARACGLCLATDDGLGWYFLPYDFSAALGSDTQGRDRLAPVLEDTDEVIGCPAFGARGSLLFSLVRDCFAKELGQAYAAMRAKGSDGHIGCDEVIAALEAHRKAWGEAVYNEDAVRKYQRPLQENGDDSYLPLAKGSGSVRGEGWLRERFDYLDAKYAAGSAMEKRALVVANAAAGVALTPYTDTYVTVRFGDLVKRVRATGGVRYVADCPTETLDGTEVAILGADAMCRIEGLAALMASYIDLSSAERVSEIRPGSGAEGFENPYLTTLLLGKHRNLRVLDVRNCPALTSSISLTESPLLEQVYAENSGIVALDLPRGGRLRVLHLPDSLRRLSVCDQPALADFSIAGCAHLHTLHVENVPIDSAAIANAAPELERARLIGVNWELDSNELLDRLATEIKGLDTTGEEIDRAVVEGKATVVDYVSDEQMALYAKRLPMLVLTVIMGLLDRTGASIQDKNGVFIYPAE